MPIDVIPTKITLPKRQGGVLRRPRLIDYLHENLERKLILVAAPAGYGKTTLLIDFATDVDLAVCWFTLDEADRDPGVFLAHLVASLQQRFPNYGRRSEVLLEHGPGSMHAAAAALVADMVSDIDEYFILILDDWQLVSDEAAIRELLDHLLRYLPEHAHLIVAGRTILRGPLVRLAALGEVAGIGADDLRFSAEEVREVLSARYQLAVSSEQAARLAEEAEGWITAILLTSQGPWQAALANLAQLRDSADALYEYLAGEVFDRLEGDLRRFLLAAAVPAQFTAALCDQLRQAADSQAFIDQVEARNLFITRVEVAGTRWYRFHHLFRKFLLARLRGIDSHLFADWHLRAALIFESQGQAEEAVDYFLAGGAPDRAARLMDALARGLHITGRRQTLRRWLESLPAELHGDAPRLVLYEGQALAEQGQLAEASRWLQAAEAAFLARDDLAGQLRAVLLRGWGALAQGNLAQAQQIGEYVQDRIETGRLDEPALLADALRLVGDSCHGLGQWPSAEAYLLRALALYRQMADDERQPFNLGRTLQDLANVLRSLGRLEEAAALQSEALGLWRALGTPGPLASCLNNVGYDRYLAGDYDQALRLLCEALDKAEEADDQHVRGWVLDSIAAVRRDRGEFGTAIDTYAQVFELANVTGDQALLSWSLDGRGHTYRLAGDLDRALALFEQAYSVAERAGLAAQQVLTTASLGVTRIEMGQVADGLAQIDRAAGTLQSENSYLDLARVRLWQAQGRYAAQDWEAAADSLQAVSRLGARLGCRPFSLAEGRHVRALLEWGANRLESDRHLRQWLEQLQTTEVTVTTQAAQEAASPRIRVQAFGPGQIWRDGRLLLAADWGGSALARELVLYLLAESPRRKDEIGAAIWPDLTGGRMTSSFHAAKYKARRALGVEFAIYQDEAYQINPVADIWCDVVEFRRLLSLASNRSGEETERIGHLRRAVDLYADHFLAGSTAEWAVEVRERLQVQFFDALAEVIDCLHEQGGAADEVLALARRGLELDYFREELHRSVLKSLAEAGAFKDALSHYDKMKDRFLQHLGVSPDEETRALVRQIRAARPPGGAQSIGGRKF